MQCTSCGQCDSQPSELDRFWREASNVTNASASESERAAGNRALMIAHTILRDRQPFHHYEGGILSASRRLRGEGFDVFSKYNFY